MTTSKARREVTALRSYTKRLNALLASVGLPLTNTTDCQAYVEDGIHEQDIFEMMQRDASRG